LLLASGPNVCQDTITGIGTPKSQHHFFELLNLVPIH